jgi:hypothetical protein
MNDVHSCSFHCQRPVCAIAQRDQLWQLLEKIYSVVNELEPKNRWTLDQAMAYAVDRLKEKK